MKTKFSGLLRIAALLFLMLFLLAGCSADPDEYLLIRTESCELTDEGALEIVLATENKTGYPVSFGWVSSCQIEVTTTEDTYYYEPFMSEIPRGKDTFSFELDECRGEVERIVITELCLLEEGHSNLPGRELHDVVVYDAKKDIDSFQGSFDLLSSYPILGVLKKMLVPAILVALAAFTVWYLLKNRKPKN